jgi:hypothetical protein
MVDAMLLRYNYYMGNRGPKPKGQVNTKWRPELAYAVGLITTDGSLSSDGRHFDLTSKDIEQLENFKKCLGLKVKIGYKLPRKGSEKIGRVQFGDVLFFKFLLGIGLTPAKTKTVVNIDVPKKYFFDFLRGHHDGDGCFYSYWDPRWKSSFMYYLTFISSSKKHLVWIRSNLEILISVKGTINTTHGGSVYQLRFAKSESLKILKKLYHSKNLVCLSRKRLKIEKALSIVGEKL